MIGFGKSRTREQQASAEQQRQAQRDASIHRRLVELEQQVAALANAIGVDLKRQAGA